MLSPLEIEALSLSLKVSLWAVAWSLVPGVAIAWLLARREFPGKALLDGIVHLPLVLPPVALGYLLLVLFGRHGPVGAWLHDWFGLNLVFSWRGAAVAAEAATEASSTMAGLIKRQQRANEELEQIEAAVEEAKSRVEKAQVEARAATERLCAAR